jgi:hypothetical protein
MFNWRNHPDDLALLRFCEGELKTRELARIERHVRGCWECSTHIDDVRRTVGDYVRYRQDVLLPAMPPPSAPWTNLDSEMQRLRTQGAVPRSRALRLPLPWVFAGLAAVAAGAAAAAEVVLLAAGLLELHAAASRHTAIPVAEICKPFLILTLSP